jgi:hypothetical protein
VCPCSGAADSIGLCSLQVSSTRGGMCDKCAKPAAPFLLALERGILVLQSSDIHLQRCPLRAASSDCLPWSTACFMQECDGSCSALFASVQSI